MKNSILKVASIIAITATSLTGCSLSSDNSNDSNGFVADPNNFKGTISGETITLNLFSYTHLAVYRRQELVIL